jgi:hypothetical protein
MVQPFNDTTRRNIAARCADFARLPESEPVPVLKRAAVAIALVEAGDPLDGTAVLLTLRAGVENVLGLLDDYPTRSGYLITPVVVWAGADAAMSPNPREVASVHRIALGDIERADAFDFVTIPESTRRVIRFRHAGRFIHAPTAALIYQFREMLDGRDTRVAELEQPVFAWK